MARHGISFGVAILAAAMAVAFVGAGASPVAGATPPAATAANSITFTGKLNTGMMAIGGETTGIIISDGKTTYELDIKDAGLRAKADQLNGKQATVQGTLTVKAGVEIAQRRIIAVETLEAAAATVPASAPASAPATQGSQRF